VLRCLARLRRLLNRGNFFVRGEKFSTDFFVPSFKNKKSKLLAPLLFAIFVSSCEENAFDRMPESKFHTDKIGTHTDSKLVYRRHDYMNQWADKDGDCRNLRHEMLMRQSLEEVVFKNTHNCIVEKGLWVDPYTNRFIRLASDLDMDHVIPLAYAHKSGGAIWTTVKKRRFAMDETNLLLVDDGENSLKGAKGPSQYLPIKSFQCDYARIWQTVSEKYKLDLSSADQTMLASVLNNCLR
jgi:hypothetical protein